MSLATIDRVIALLSKHSGRDKIAKVLHYGARIIIWYYTNKGLTKNAKITEKFRQTIGESRRVGVRISRREVLTLRGSFVQLVQCPVSWAHFKTCKRRALHLILP